MPEFYGREGLRREEALRLKWFPHPHDATRTAFAGRDLRGQTVLDAGCGPDPRLALSVGEQGGKYIGLDRWNVGEVTMFGPNAGAHFLRGDIRSLPFEDASMNTSHERFVLNSIPNSEDRTAAITELMRVTKPSGSVFFLEYDWSSIWSGSDAERLARFIAVFRDISNLFSIDPYVGATLKMFVKDILANTRVRASIFAERSCRMEDNYTEELVANTDKQAGLCVSFVARLEDIATSASDADTIRRANDIRSRLVELVADLRARPMRFVPPDIVIVRVMKARE